MHRKYYVVIRVAVLMALAACSQPILSQEDTVAESQRDSILAEQQRQTRQLLSEADSIRIADSLEQAELLRQIQEVQESDARRTAELQVRLDSFQRAQQEREARIRRQVDSLRANTPGVPVVIFGDTVFYVYSRLGPFTPSIRAATIASKVEGLVDDYEFDAEKVQVVAVEEFHDVIHGETIILSLADRDAFWLDMSRKDVAEMYAQAIVDSVEDYRRRTGIWRTLLRVGLLLLVIAIFGFGIRYMNKGFSWVTGKVYAVLDPYITGIKFRNYEFLSVQQEERALRIALNILKWLTIILVIYLALPIMFSIFPATQGIATTLIGYFLTPLRLIVSALVGYIPELFTIVVIILVTRYFVRFLGFLTGEVESRKLQIPGFYPDWAKPTFNILRIIIYAFAFIVIFPYLPGSDSPIFRGVSVFFGLLISLGSSSAISNIIAGLVITYMRAFNLGDRVKIGDTQGDVIEKTMLVTKIRTIKNEDVTIPNSAILSGSTVNYSVTAREIGLILNTTITIGYDAEWRQVHELLINAALKTEHILAEPKPFVFQTSLDDFYVSYQINAYTNRAELSAKIYSELHSNIQDAFNEAGVEIMSPHYRASRDGNVVTIPPIYLPPDYKAPTFTITVEQKPDDDKK